MKTVIAGHSKKQDVVTEAKILNRVIRVVPGGWEYGCDQRHAEIFLEEMQMKDCKFVGTPGLEERSRKEATEDEGSQPLGAGASTQYRALSARANYMSQERADIQYAVKELCRSTSAPHHKASERLTQFASYLVGRSRAVSSQPWHQARRRLLTRTPTQIGPAARPAARVRLVARSCGGGLA